MEQIKLQTCFKHFRKRVIQNTCPNVLWLTSQERNLTQDGGFGHWSPWQACNHDDGGEGTSTCQCRTRSCDNPRPQCGGMKCVGANIEVANCSRYTYCTHPYLFLTMTTILTTLVKAKKWQNTIKALCIFKLVMLRLFTRHMRTMKFCITDNKPVVTYLDEQYLHICEHIQYHSKVWGLFFFMFWK